MSRNIKEIGKELLGKSLNSYHRKTGLTQLEKNNKMQDGILDGILSQVDDAYIEKTEQSNVIHLDGSGDGVVVLDSVEGNTMVNCSKTFKGYTLIPNSSPTHHNRVSAPASSFVYKPSTVYTFIINIKENTLTGFERIVPIDGYNTLYVGNFSTIGQGQTGIYKLKVTTRQDISTGLGFQSLVYSHNGDEIGGKLVVEDILLLEGDWTNRDIPTSYFEGLQSSFEEKVNYEGKYEIEILLKNRNLVNIKELKNYEDSNGKLTKDANDVITFVGKKDSSVECVSNIGMSDLKVYLEEGVTYTVGFKSDGVFGNVNGSDTVEMFWLRNGRASDVFFNVSTNSRTVTISKSGWYYARFDVNKGDATHKFWDIFIIRGTSYNNFIPHKQNKIKLLLDEPLRKITSDIKDRLCIKNGKLIVERKCKQVKFDGTIGISSHRYDETNQIQIIIVYPSPTINDKKNNSKYTINSTLPCITEPAYGMRTVPNFSGYVDSSAKFVGAIPNKTGRSYTDKEVKNYFKENPMDVIYELEEPYYEEVLNEYGETIILEGYENGTIYIDSTIVPTTTVRYTPKMESFKTLKEVENNNIMLTNDVNDNIIPYMMDVDLMIMEKEMALMSHKNIRKMEVLDMTSMQKRTQDMLERLIKGKTLTEQECKTRVTTYLHAGKITDEQAEELMLLIDEVYA